MWMWDIYICYCLIWNDSIRIVDYVCVTALLAWHNWVTASYFAVIYVAVVIPHVHSNVLYIFRTMASAPLPSPTAMSNTLQEWRFVDQLESHCVISWNNNLLEVRKSIECTKTNYKSEPANSEKVAIMMASEPVAIRWERSNQKVWSNLSYRQKLTTALQSYLNSFEEK